MNNIYELLKQRILELREEEFGKYTDYVRDIACSFSTLFEVYEIENPSLEQYKLWNDKLFLKIKNDYENSILNPELCVKKYGVGKGKILCFFAAQIRNSISFFYEKNIEEAIKYMELFLQIVSSLKDGSTVKELKENAYYFIHDYASETIAENLRRMLIPKESSHIYNIITKSDFNDISYLYRYGLYISDNEIQIAKYLNELPEKQLIEMAQTYTDGFRRGFEAAKIDLSKKKTVQLRYSVGFEPMMKHAIKQFEMLGLYPTFTKACVLSTKPDRQYDFDHRFSDAVYLNKALVKEKLVLFENEFQKLSEEASVFAGPAVVETFGENLFLPKYKKDAFRYTKEQEKLALLFKRDSAIIQNKFIPQEERSFTIISYPIPEIGEKFCDIFDETIKVNTLDNELYKSIQTSIINELDKGDVIHITGRGKNKTDLYIKLHELKDKNKETNFENCVADVNIPVGEVFTSPVLKGTNGVLFVSQVYLNGLRYENLQIEFKDGMVCDYSCTNYKDTDEGKSFIKENILHNNDTLPIGEFAIGTNTTAYMMGRKYGIENKLPILIAEKTGPHFALGDTCYSMSEEVRLYNPDGKEIIAKDNECSILRKTNIEKAYFNCHTDITIPYDELGDISVIDKNKTQSFVIKDGRFCLDGTKQLNAVLQ